MPHSLTVATMEEEDFSGDSELDQPSDAGDELDFEEEQWGGGSRSSSRASQQSRSSTPGNQDSIDMGEADAFKHTEEVGDNKPNDAEGEATSTSFNDGSQTAEEKGKKRKKKTPQQPGEKKKRKKKEGGEKKKKKSKPGHLRRNIRKLKADDKLEAETLAAQQEEMERKRRLEMQRSQNLPTPGFMAEDMDLADLDFSTGQLDFSNLMEAEAELAPSTMYTEPAIPAPVPPTEQPATCASTEEPPEPKLEPTPDETPTEDVTVPKVTPAPAPTPMMPQQADDSDDVICLDSSSSGDEETTAKTSKPTKTDVVELGSSDDDVMIVSGDDEDQEEEEEEDDTGNSGSHTDDATNQPDALGKVLINVNHPSTESDIFLSSQLGRSVKPHQIGGIRFLYDNLVESLERYKSSGGFGCILAHSMGLGKTLQVISFIDVFLRHTEAKTVLCIVPINTLQNWSAEFNMWLPTKEAVDTAIQQGIAQEGEIQHREFGVYLLNDNYRTNLARAKLIDKWFKTGGVLLMGYEMYRLLISKKIMLTNNKKRRGKNPKDMEVIDLEEEDTNLAILHGVYKALAKPGPDLVICDEGHRIKNAHTSVSQTLKNIRTKRRVVLTGYPLQNNLMEYWCMVDFVRPNFLGTRQEFSNMFERPIANGQCIDSTPEDVRYMRYRAHVLHSLLEGFVQRRGHAVLKSVLPPKYEHVLLVRMSAIQRQLYARFMTAFREAGAAGWSNNNPLRAFSVCCKIWNHPDILYEILQKKMMNDDLDIEDAEALGNKSRSRSNTPTIPDGSKRSGSPAVPLMASTSGVTDENSNSNGSSKDRRFTQDVGLTTFQEKANQGTNYNWAEDSMKDYTPGVLENGGKMLLLFKIIEQSIRGGDKLLVYSQSLNTLSLIEEFLAKTPMPEPPTGFPHNIPLRWAKNKTYYRLDGSTSGQEREKMINQFNAPNSPTWLFLLSTRAGCLGVNLVGANRVVVFDASWNPCHDCQAVCRVYRYGQTKPCHIYRLVTDKSLEKKIYDRQVNKQGMSDRVVDELQPESNFTRKEVEDLFSYDDSEPVYEDFSQDAPKFADPILQGICTEHSKLITKAPFQHESLLIDRKDHKLTKAEKRAAKKSYEQEKRMSVSNYSRPSYSAFYPQQQSAGTPGSSGGTASISSLISFARAQTGMPPMIHRPVANVRPIQSTPIPMQPRTSGSNDVQVFQRGGHNIMVNHVKTTMDIPIPGSASSSSSVQKIPAGSQITVIRTHRGMYIRTNDGKIFAVRAGAPGMNQVLRGSLSSAPSNHGNQGIPVQDSGPSLSASAVNEALDSATASSAPPGQSLPRSVATSAPMVSALLSGTPSQGLLGRSSPMVSTTTITATSANNVASSSEAAAMRQVYGGASTAEVPPFLTTSSKEPFGNGKQDGNSSEADKSTTQRPESTGGLSSGSSLSRPASQNLERTSPISQAADSSVPAVTSSGVLPSIPPLVSQQNTTQSGGIPNFSFPAPSQSQALNMNIPGMGNISPSPLQNLMTFVPSYLNPGAAQPQPGMIPGMYNYPGMMPPFGLVAAPLPFLPSAPPPNMQGTLGNAVPLSGYPPQPGMAIPTSTTTTSQEAAKSTDEMRSSPFNFDDIVQLD
ncbi:helicase ARIP4-like isoform X2 [Branchiostoma lanceolatum]|uniref:helicase ARIP4-like isoform X2 n=1 Tax=Branchiostoma lanceolatum TaxID=7740 RepID=UPI003453C8DE